VNNQLRDLREAARAGVMGREIKARMLRTKRDSCDKRGKRLNDQLVLCLIERAVHAREEIRVIPVGGIA